MMIYGEYDDYPKLRGQLIGVIHNKKFPFPLYIGGTLKMKHKKQRIDHVLFL